VRSEYGADHTAFAPMAGRCRLKRVESCVESA